MSMYSEGTLKCGNALCVFKMRSNLGVMNDCIYWIINHPSEASVSPVFP
jgi:hypothetical protein